MKFKLIRDNGYHGSDEVLFQSDDLLEVAQFAEEKSGGSVQPPDIGLDFGGDGDGGGLL